MQYRDAKAGYVKQPGRRAPSIETVQAYDDRAYTSRGGPHVISAGCNCKAAFRPGLVLDPFMGTGTTAVVARRLARDFIGFEVSSKYVAMARERIASAGTRTSA
ncbi:MAG: DNA methyltransferase [Phycisphaerae bacterium]